MSSLLNPTTVVEPHSLNVTKLFERDYLVPENQRDFAWKTKQIEEFFSDLFSHYQVVAPNNDLVNHKGYFIGSTVVTQEDENAPCVVVDGQQRYTVLSLIILVLRDQLVKREQNASEKPQAMKAIFHAFESCLYAYSGGELKTRMTYSDPTTDEAYRNYIHALSSQKIKEAWNQLPRERKKRTSPYSTLYSAYRTARRQVLLFLRKSKTKEERDKKLQSFSKLILEYVVVLQIRSFSFEETYQIFQSLNDRGLRLSQADLVKNEVLKKAQSDKAYVLDAWNDSKEYIADLESIAMPELLHYSFLSRHGEIKAAKLFPQIRSKLSAGMSAKSYATELEADAMALTDLVNSKNYPLDIPDLLTDITKKLGHQFVYPILLSIHRKFGQTPPDFKKALIFVRSLLIRYMIVGDGTPEGLAQIAFTSGEICRTSEPNLKILDNLSKFFLDQAPDNRFTRAFADHSQRNTSIAGLLVSDLENHLLKTGGTQVLKHSQLSHLEHIMPKKVTQSDWPTMYSAKQADSEEWAALLWSIGNLMMLPQKLNIKIQNKDISVKISAYNQTPLQLGNVSRYLDSGEWTGSSIKRRQADFASIAPVVWPLV
jgi:hypothetical protein